MLWKACNHNPVLMLGRVPQASLAKAAADPRYLALYRRACERLRRLHAAPGFYSGMLVAYFSMEYGLVDCMPIYSGGLGILSGDHLKAASDAGIPLVGVGLLYQKGYLQQSLNPDGWQQERNPVNDFYTLPVSPVIERRAIGSAASASICPPARCSSRSGSIECRPGEALPAGHEHPGKRSAGASRHHRRNLYGGDTHTRMRQEIVLGIGGLRALKALGLEPHRLSHERRPLGVPGRGAHPRADGGAGLSFEEALDASRANNVFTTHTSVPAGIDLFDPGMMYEYFQRLLPRKPASRFDQFLALGRAQPVRYPASPSRWRSGHQDLLLPQRGQPAASPGLAGDVAGPVAAVCRSGKCRSPSITNGVHLPTWLNGDLAELYDQYLQPDWRERYPDPKIWDLVDDIPATELWEAHRRRKTPSGGLRPRACREPAPRSGKALRAEIRRLARGAGSRRLHHRLCTPLRRPTSARPCCSAT